MTSAVRLESKVLRMAAGIAGLSAGDRLIEGPLKGHHHETYVIPLPDGSRGKVREPREGLLWFDRRCFASEEEVLLELAGHVSRIPTISEVGQGVLLQGFIEGRTVHRGVLPNRALSPKHQKQLGQLFAELVSFEIRNVGARRLCDASDRPSDGDSHGFLMRLIHFTEERVYQEHGAPYHALFAELGVQEGALGGIKDLAGKLTERSFAFVHGDLHRRNFIVDGQRGDLWTIDWELAMIGDPLYDLATHLHLMRYPVKEAGRVTELWRRAVEDRRSECVKGWDVDLKVLLAYKRAQSVYTDVIRAVLALRGPGPEPDLRRLPLVAWRVQQALAAARQPLGLRSVPSVRQVISAYANWFRTRSPMTTDSAL
ncbi:phosphotransferase [Streptomyces sp. NPDC057575]|uniref:phosphotransferase n=1 Tax=unclassified Streptomyces TaxID=2593676 RepID=UPI0036851BA0